MSDIRQASIEPSSDRLPGGFAAQAGPFAILAAAGVVLCARWGGLPARMPVHWNFHGEPDRWVAHSLLAVGLPLAVGAIVCALSLSMARGMLRLAPRGDLRAPALRLILLAEYVISLVVCGAVLSAVTLGRMLVPTLLVALAGLAMILVLAWRMRGARPDALRNPAGWHGAFYADRGDPALFVPKRYGFGYTLNFGHPAALPLLAATLALPLLALLLAAISAR
jgi:uncharacterized membrane protein